MIILDYLEGRAEYDALTEAERCAICAAMEGAWPRIGDNGKMELIECHPSAVSILLGISPHWSWQTQDTADFWEEDYLHDGTAALRLVERFDLILGPDNWSNRETMKISGDGRWLCSWIAPHMSMHEYEAAPTPQAAIVAAVCALARAQWYVVH